jgi:hypothetical protein
MNLPKCADPECDHGETCQCDVLDFVRFLKAENIRLREGVMTQTEKVAALVLEQAGPHNRENVESVIEAVKDQHTRCTYVACPACVAILDSLTQRSS